MAANRPPCWTRMARSVPLPGSPLPRRVMGTARSLPRMVAAVGTPPLATAATGMATSTATRAAMIKARFMVGSLQDGCWWRALPSVHRRPATGSVKIVDLVTGHVTPTPRTRSEAQPDHADQLHGAALLVDHVDEEAGAGEGDGVGVRCTGERLDLQQGLAGQRPLGEHPVDVGKRLPGLVGQRGDQCAERGCLRDPPAGHGQARCRAMNSSTSSGSPAAGGRLPRRSCASVAAHLEPPWRRSSTSRYHASTTCPSGFRSWVWRAVSSAWSSSASKRARSAAARAARTNSARSGRSGPLTRSATLMAPYLRPSVVPVWQALDLAVTRTRLLRSATLLAHPKGDGEASPSGWPLDGVEQSALLGVKHARPTQEGEAAVTFGPQPSVRQRPASAAKASIIASAITPSPAPPTGAVPGLSGIPGGRPCDTGCAAQLGCTPAHGRAGASVAWSLALPGGSSRLRAP